MEAAVPLLRTGGRYVLIGAVFPSSPLSLDPERVVRGWLQIRGVHNYAPEDLSAAVTFLDQHHTRFPFSELLTRTFPLTEVSQGFSIRRGQSRPSCRHSALKGSYTVLGGM